MRNIVSPLDGIRSPFGRRLGAAPFSPASLFAASEPGGWYDPSDLTTLYQDAAGTTPVTAVEQPVGLVLDKSRGLVLGSELVTNGDFSNGTTGWTDVTAALSVVSGEGVVTSASSFGYVRQTLTTVVGRTYLFTLNARIGTTNRITFAVANGAVVAETTSSTATALRCVYTASATTTNIWLQVNNAGTGVFDNISIRELPGNHAFQTTSTARPILSARYNQLTYTEQFDNAAWVAIGTKNVSPNSTVAPDGTSTADTISDDNAAAFQGCQQGFTAVSGVTYTGSIYVKKTTGTPSSYPLLQIGISAPSSFVAVIINTSAGTLYAVPSGGDYMAVTSSSITGVGDYWRVTLGYTANTTTPLFQFYPAASSNGTSLTSAATGSAIIWGADLRPANAGVGLPAYQRVGAAVSATTNPAVTGVPDYDTTGFPLYLKFDGTDDSLSSAAIDFSATDKMSVFAGVRKLSDAAAGIIAELTADANNTNGGFSALIASSNGTDRASFGAVTRGTITDNSRQARTYVAPVTAVLAWSMDNGAATQALQLVPRVNGATPGTIYNASAGGTLAGNFANAALFIGRRNNASAPLNGHLYSLIVRGAATDAATITATETWVNSKTLAY